MEELKKKIEKLKKYGKKTISKTDLESVFATSSDEALFEIISILYEQQILMVKFIFQILIQILRKPWNTLSFL